MTFEFFLSYCRDDDANREVAEFFEDLRTEVWRRQDRRDKDQIGFRDIEMRPGVEWGSTTIRALSTAKVFVPLCSPHYFGSPSCGKEWWLTSRRRQGSPGEDTGIVPILWEVEGHSDPDRTEVADALQRTGANLGKTYRTRGLRHMVRLKQRYIEEYENVVYELAGLIIDVARKAPLAPFTDEVTFASLTDAFAGRAARPAGRGASGHVHFVVAAGTDREMRDIRTSVDHYGASELDWKPYAPKDKERILLHAQKVAGEEDLIVTPHVAAAELSDLTDKAASANQIVVLLVDPWAVRIERYRDLIGRYDSDPSLRTAAVVPWPSDPLTTEQEDSLRQEVAQTMWRFAHEPTRYRDRVRSMDEFGTTLREIIVQIQAWIMANSRVPRLATGPRIARPTLSVSAGATSTGERG